MVLLGAVAFVGVVGALLRAVVLAPVLGRVAGVRSRVEGWFPVRGGVCMWSVVPRGGFLAPTCLSGKGVARGRGAEPASGVSWGWAPSGAGPSRLWSRPDRGGREGWRSAA